MSLLPEAHFAEDDDIVDWRARLGEEDDEDDDEELETTPEDVVGMLGFDPKDLQ